MSHASVWRCMWRPLTSGRKLTLCSPQPTSPASVSTRVMALRVLELLRRWERYGADRRDLRHFDNLDGNACDSHVLSRLRRQHRRLPRQGSVSPLLASGGAPAPRAGVQRPCADYIRWRPGVGAVGPGGELRTGRPPPGSSATARFSLGLMPGRGVCHFRKKVTPRHAQGNGRADATPLARDCLHHRGTIRGCERTPPGGGVLSHALRRTVPQSAWTPCQRYGWAGRSGCRSVCGD